MKNKAKRLSHFQTSKMIQEFCGSALESIWSVGWVKITPLFYSIEVQLIISFCSCYQLLGGSFIPLSNFWNVALLIMWIFSMLVSSFHTVDQWHRSYFLWHWQWNVLFDLLTNRCFNYKEFLSFVQGYQHTISFKLALKM